MIKKVYQFNLDDKIYKGIITLDESDKSPSGNWNLPSDCSEVAPPAEKKGFVNVWDGSAWVETEDHRKEKYWLPEDKYGAPGREVKEIGSLPEGATLTPPEQTLNEAKTTKISELKMQRDAAEVQPIEYNSHSFDYDDKARDRINAAIIALEMQGEGASLSWTLADNTSTQVTAADLKSVIAAVAVRSNALHVAYRAAKEKVQSATSKEKLAEITLV